MEIKDLKGYHKNPRKIDEETFNLLSSSLVEFGDLSGVIFNVKSGEVVGGNQRTSFFKKHPEATILITEKFDTPTAAGTVAQGYISFSGEKYTYREVDWDEKKEERANILANKVSGAWDFDMLANGFDIDMLLESGWKTEEFGFGKAEGEAFTDGERKEVARKVLSEVFIVPPMSTFDTKRDYWQQRKQHWVDLGLRSFEGREGLKTTGAFSGTVPGYYDFKNKKEEELGRKISHKEMEEKYVPEMIKDSNLAYTKTGGLLSIFDPVLTEISYRWFTPSEGVSTIVDPFAGGSVRGIVASMLGFNYIGIDLSKEQIDQNVIQADEILVDKEKPKWIVGDSLNIDTLVTEKADMIFSCPPYFDLEIYCDDKDDLSNQSWDDFLKNYREIIKKSCNLLKDDRFACFVVSEVRKKDGNGGEYRNFVGETVRAFTDAGLSYYNEFILLNSFGSAAIRAKKQFNSARKNVRVHQNVLVFYKGDPKNIKNNFKEIDFSGIENLLETNEDADEASPMF